jgi:hypothetical protein
LQPDDSLDDPLLFLLLALDLPPNLQQLNDFFLHLLFPSLSSKGRLLSAHPLHDAGLLLILPVLLARHDYRVFEGKGTYKFIDAGNRKKASIIPELSYHN